MKPEKVLFTLLSAGAGVTALAGTRIYSEVAPQGTVKPFIVLSLVGDTPDYPIDATPGSDPWTGRIQATCLGASSESSKRLAEACMSACYKKNGPIGGVQVIAVLIDTRGASHYDMDVDTYQQSVDFVVHYYR